MKDEAKIERQKEIRKEIAKARANGEIKIPTQSKTDQNAGDSDSAIENEPASNWNDDDEEEDEEKDSDSANEDEENEVKSVAKRPKLK